MSIHNPLIQEEIYTRKNRLFTELGESLLSKLTSRRVVMDLGCSFGANTVRLADLNKDSIVYGVDRNLSVVRDPEEIFPFLVCSFILEGGI